MNTLIKVFGIFLLLTSSAVCDERPAMELSEIAKPFAVELESNQGATIFEESNQPGSPIEGIGLIVNLEDFTHFESVVKESFRILQKINSKMDHVYAVGITRDPQKLVPLLMGITLWGGQYKRITTLPEQYEKYKITRSPVWIVQTKQGEVLIEGRDSIRKFLNHQGEFVAPESNSAALPTEAVQASAESSAAKPESVEPDRNDLFGAK